MITLPLKLRKNGFDYTQILKGKRSAIFEQNVYPGIKYFEAFIIKIKSRRVINEKAIGEKRPFQKMKILENGYVHSGIMKQRIKDSLNGYFFEISEKLSSLK